MLLYSWILSSYSDNAHIIARIIWYANIKIGKFHIFLHNKKKGDKTQTFTGSKLRFLITGLFLPTALPHPFPHSGDESESDGALEAQRGESVEGI